MKGEEGGSPIVKVKFPPYETTLGPSNDFLASTKDIPVYSGFGVIKMIKTLRLHDGNGLD